MFYINEYICRIKIPYDKKILNKYINESYNYLKGYNFDDEVLFCLVLISTYYKIHDMEKLFYEAFKKTLLFIEYDTTFNIYKKYFNKEIPTNYGSIFNIFPRNIDFEKKKYNNEFRIISLGYIFNNEVLDSKSFLKILINEFNHSVSSINDSFKFIDHNFVIRNGLAELIHCKNKSSIKKNVMLNEFYNEQFTDEILNEVSFYTT